MCREIRARSGYRSIRTAIWLIGVGVLALADWWWPGIIFLIGISMLVSVVLPSSENSQDEGPHTPHTDRKLANQGVDKQENRDEIIDIFNQSLATLEVNGNWLPSRCPACGAPIEAGTAFWKEHLHQRAICLYCDTHLEPVR